MLPPAPRGSPGRWLSVLGVFFVIGAANALFPVLRFDSQAANWAAACVLFSTPLVAPVFLLRLEGRRLFRILGCVGLTPLIAASLLLALVSGSCLQQTQSKGTDPSFQTLARLPLEGSRVTAYLSNSGSMGSLTVFVRHEKTLVPGLLLVRSVLGRHGAREATLRAVGPLDVEVRVDGGAPTVIALRRFVYV